MKIQSDPNFPVNPNYHTPPHPTKTYPWLGSELGNSVSVQMTGIRKDTEMECIKCAMENLFLTWKTDCQIISLL